MVAGPGHSRRGHSPALFTHLSYQTVTGKTTEHQKPQAPCSQGLRQKTPEGSILKSHFFRLWDPLARTNIYRYKLFHEFFGESFLSFTGSQREGQEPSILGEISC